MQRSITGIPSCQPGRLASSRFMRYHLREKGGAIPEVCTLVFSGRACRAHTCACTHTHAHAHEHTCIWVCVCAWTTHTEKFQMITQWEFKANYFIYDSTHINVWRTLSAIRSGSWTTSILNLCGLRYTMLIFQARFQLLTTFTFSSIPTSVCLPHFFFIGFLTIFLGNTCEAPSWRHENNGSKSVSRNWREGLGLVKENTARG